MKSAKILIIWCFYLGVSKVVCAKAYLSNESNDKHESISYYDRNNENKPIAWITIFVHGIMSIKPHLSLTNTIKLLKDDIDNTLYSKTVELMRNNPFFYKNQTMQEFGLQKVNMFDTTRGNASGALAQLFEITSYYTGAPPTINYYYTYGWSGVLSANIRYRDSISFFELLEQLVNKFKNQGIEPKIRLIGYSHGGNICLNLGSVLKNKYPQSELVIHELILIGTPIVREAERAIHAPMFKKVYNIYSKKDYVQVLDIFSANQSFSSRLFKPHKGLPLPHKLVQIEIKITRTNKSIQCSSQRYALTNNFQKQYILSGNRTHLLRNASPGHSELWFFGWTPHNFRKTYPFYPLPTISFAPFITYHIEHGAFHTPASCPLLVDIRPEHEVVIIKNRAENSYTVIPFLNRKQLKHMQKTALLFKPDNYTNDLYHYYVEAAYQQVLEYSESKIKPIYKRMLRRHRRKEATCDEE